MPGISFLGGGAGSAASVAAEPSGELTGITVADQLDQIAGILAARLQSSPDFLADYVQVYDEFLNNGVTTGLIGSLGWDLQVTAGGGAAIPAADLGAPGVLSLTTGTTGDAAGIALNGFSIIGTPEFTIEWRSKVNNLNDATHQATHKVGTMDIGILPNNGLWFEYAAALGDNWICKSRVGGGTLEQTDSGVPVATEFTRLRIVADGSGVAYFLIDDVLVATHTTQLPATQNHTPRAYYNRTAGAANRSSRHDYFYMKLARAA